MKASQVYLFNVCVSVVVVVVVVAIVVNCNRKGRWLPEQKQLGTLVSKKSRNGRHTGGHQR